jgi:hypothetical protein
MNAAKVQEIIVKVVVTFLEAGIAYWVATGQKVDKVALAGVVGAGLSAVYNVVQHYLGN